MDEALVPLVERGRDLVVATLGHAQGLVDGVPERALVDLDTDRRDRSSAIVARLVLVAPSLLDLRRLAAHAARLPRAKRVAVLAVLPRTGVLRPPVRPSPRPLAVRVERGRGCSWIVDAEHHTHVDPAVVLAGVLGSSGLGRPSHPGFLVGADGPEVADWLVGEVAPRWVRAPGSVPDQPAGADADPPESGGDEVDDTGIAGGLADEEEQAAARPAADDADGTAPAAAVPVDALGASRAETTVDVLVTCTDRESPIARTLRVRRPEDVRWDDLPELARAGLDPTDLPPVDERAVNPTGFLVETGDGVPLLTWSVAGTGWRVSGGATSARIGSPGGRLSDVDVGRLRTERAVRIDPRDAPGPLVSARLVVALAVAGVPMLLDDVPGWLADLVGPGVAGSLRPDPETLADPLRREEHSVRLRRAALRTHASHARWAGLGRSLGVLPPRGEAAEVGVLLCTRRPELVGSALDQVAAQREVRVHCVLAAHGFDPTSPQITRELARVRGESGLDVDVVAVGEHVAFGGALNAAARVTSAPLLAKMDDDDWYGPDHLGDLVLAAGYSGADLLGCAAEFVYLESIDLTVRRTWTGESYGRNLAGGTLLLRREVFDAVGGFRMIPRSVDRELIRAVVGCGATVYRGHGLNYVLRRASSGHTWTSRLGYFVVDGAPQWAGFRPSALLAAG